MATRCCCPPDRRAGRDVGLVLEPDALEQLTTARLRRVAVEVEHGPQGEGDVAEGRLVGKEVELLEDHAHRLADLVEVAVGRGDLHAVDDDAT